RPKMRLRKPPATAAPPAAKSPQPRPLAISRANTPDLNRRRKSQTGRRRRNESVEALYSAARCHCAADGGDRVMRSRGLQTAAGLRAAAGRLPDDPVRHVLSWGQPGSDGLVGDGAARAAVRAGSRPQPDAVDKSGWKPG